MWKRPQMELFFIPQRLKMLEDVEFQVGSALWYFYGGANFSRESGRQSALPSLLSFSDISLRQY